MLHSGGELTQEDTLHVGSFGLTNYSSLSDVEVIEHIGTKNNAENICESSTPHSEKETHVHFEDLSTSHREQNTPKNTEDLSINCNAGKKSMVHPNQLGAGGGDERELLRSTSERQQVQRNCMYNIDDKISINLCFISGTCQYST